jgi:hypothetical protein
LKGKKKMTDKVFYENLKRAEQVKEKMLKNIEKANLYTKEIMELIDEKEELTQSDLQGAVMGIVVKILTEEKK